MKQQFVKIGAWRLGIVGAALSSLVPMTFAPPSFAATTKTASKPKTTAKKPAAPLIVQGTVQEFTRPPRPGSVPYKDAIVSLHLTNLKIVSGQMSSSQIVVFVWGMKNKKWTRAATLRKGQTVRLRLTPWEKVERKYGSYNRFELDDKKLWDLDTYWAELL